MSTSLQPLHLRRTFTYKSGAYMFTDTYTRTREICSRVRICIRIHMHIKIIYKCTCTCICIYTYICIYIYTCHIHAYVNVYVHAYVDDLTIAEGSPTTTIAVTPPPRTWRDAPPSLQRLQRAHTGTPRRHHRPRAAAAPASASIPHCAIGRTQTAPAVQSSQGRRYRLTLLPPALVG